MGLDAYEVGGCVRDELMGREAKDVDIAVSGVSYDELEAKLSPHGFVHPNIVGGGKLGLRVFTDANPDGELLKPEKGETYRALVARAEVSRGFVSSRPEVYDGTGALVGCRLFTDWTPEEGIEISLARTERSTATGRKHFETTVDPSVGIEEDLRRRDFTVNAIARHLLTGELIDPFGGEQDLKDGILRTVTPQSFEEDPSRIIRGLARISKDDLTPDAETLEQMRQWSHLLPSEPPEQIYRDMREVLKGRHAAKALRIARDTGVLETIIPEFKSVIGFKQESRYHGLSLDEHILLAVEHASELGAPESVRWAALLHDIGKPATAFRGKDENLHYYAPQGEATCPSCQRQVIIHPEGHKELVSGESLCAHCSSSDFGQSHEAVGAALARQALERFRQPDNALLDKVELLVKEHMYRDEAKLEPLRARKFAKRIGRDSVEELMLLRRADRAAKDEHGLRPEWDEELSQWEQLVRREMHAPLYAKELAISGHDALAFGFKGPAIGGVLEDILSQVVADPSNNERERLLKWLAKRAVKAQLVEATAADELALSLV